MHAADSVPEHTHRCWWDHRQARWYCPRDSEATVRQYSSADAPAATDWLDRSVWSWRQIERAGAANGADTARSAGPRSGRRHRILTHRRRTSISILAARSFD